MARDGVRRSPGERSVDSIAWKINSEIVLLLGWNPAILLQVAHPLVAAGVVDHSLFLTDPAGRARRLWRTLNVMFDLTFGLPDEVQRAADAINAVHDRVHGELRQAAGPFEAGRRYSAHDPELLRWVHCTMLEVFPRTYRLYVGPLSDAEWDRYCAEASRVEPLLGVPDGFLPNSLPALRTYMRETLASGQIAVSEESRMLAHDILNPRLPLPLPAAAAVLPVADGRAAAAVSAGGVRLRLGQPPRAPDARQRPTVPAAAGADAEPAPSLAGRPAGVRAGAAWRAGAANLDAAWIGVGEASHDGC